MRDIKFRGKNIDTKQWIYGDLLHKGDKTYIGYWVKDDDSPSGDGYIECEVIPETVGQYIGIEDMNKKEIYQHDIVTLLNVGEVFTGIVIYDLKEQSYKLTDGKPDWHDFSYLAGCEEIEKLGNNFDNPKLLKEANKIRNQDF